ncbi:MAG: hypothetical protein Q7S52_04695 [bacterium]|nr:hypothetical protein [bacterium]
MITFELSLGGSHTRRISGPVIALGREQVGQHVRAFLPATVCRIAATASGMPTITRERDDIPVGLNGADLDLNQPAPLPREGTIEIADVSFTFKVESR